MDIYILLAIPAVLMVVVAVGVKLLEMSMAKDEAAMAVAGRVGSVDSVDHPAGRPAALSTPEETSFTAHPAAADDGDEREYRIEIVVQLLFVHLRLDGIFIDTIVLQALGVADGAVQIGSPLSLRLQRPEHEVTGVCTEALLELWADRSEVLSLEICVKGERVRAELCNGGNRVVLDVFEGAGLP